MKRILQLALCGLLLVSSAAVLADARVFNLNTPNTQTVIDALQSKYGDAIQVELVQQKLVVVGDSRTLAEVGGTLARIDPAPAPLRLQLRAQPPLRDDGKVITYSAKAEGYSLDTVEGTFVVLRHDQLAQQIGEAGRDGRHGWTVSIHDTPAQIDELTLQITLRDKRSAMIVVSYTRLENQQRRVYGNTLVGELGTWIALLPQPQVAEGVVSSGPAPSSQLYLRVDKAFPKASATR